MKITATLGTLDGLAKMLENYSKSLERKTDLLCQRIAEAVSQEAQRGFDSSDADVLVAASAIRANVSVDIQRDGKMVVVVASGEDAVFVEFGAGVWFNGSVGSSPHPKGAELGYTIGGYGKGLGRLEKWTFQSGNKRVTTHGTPAKMPLYNAVQRVAPRIPTMAEEVFRSA